MLNKFWIPFQTPAPSITATMATPASQNSKNTPIQKPAKKQQAHVEEKSDKQPSRIFQITIYSWLSRRFTARGFTSRDPTRV